MKEALIAQGWRAEIRPLLVNFLIRGTTQLAGLDVITIQNGAGSLSLATEQG